MRLLLLLLLFFSGFLYFFKLSIKALFSLAIKFRICGVELRRHWHLSLYLFFYFLNQFYYVKICLNINRVTIYKAKCLGIVTLKVFTTTCFSYNLVETSTKFSILKMKIRSLISSFFRIPSTQLLTLDMIWQNANNEPNLQSWVRGHWVNSVKRLGFPISDGKKICKLIHFHIFIPSHFFAKFNKIFSLELF